MCRLSPYDYANLEGLHNLEYRYQSMFQQLPLKDWEEALLPLKEVRDDKIGQWQTMSGANDDFYFVCSSIDNLLLHLIRQRKQNGRRTSH